MKVFNLNVKRGADGSKHLDIQVHGIIDDTWVDSSSVAVDAITSELQQHLDAKTIGLRINSVGGSAFAGIALYNALQAHPAEVTSFVEGVAASAASIIAMAGKTIMGKGAMMMIHAPWTLTIGGAAELRKTADMLDKLQAGLASIYVAKTGKTIDEVQAMISAETWFTADEAMAAGFAQSIGDEVAPPVIESAPAPDGEKAAPEARVLWNGVRFPSARFPQEVLAMARPRSQDDDSKPDDQGKETVPPAPAAPPEDEQGSPPPPQPAPATAPGPAARGEITRAELAALAPEVMAVAMAEARAAGVAEERARLKAIDELSLKGCEDLVAQAKYGPTPMTAGDLAVAALKAGQQAGMDLLAARRRESEAAAALRQTAPAINDLAAQEAAAAKNIAEHANRSRRGGAR